MSKRRIDGKVCDVPLKREWRGNVEWTERGRLRNRASGQARGSGPVTFMGSYVVMFGLTRPGSRTTPRQRSQLKPALHDNLLARTSICRNPA